MTAPKLRKYFSKLQDSFHFAVSGKIAAELVLDNVDGQKPFAGMIAYSGEENKIKKQDVQTGRNYLEPDQLKRYEILYNQLLLFVEMQMLNKEPMTLAKWEHQVREVIIANGLDPFNGYSHENLRPIANKKAEQELDAFKARKGIASKKRKRIT